MKSNRGKSFETVILASQRDVVRLERIEQAAKRIGKGRMIPLKSPCDFTGTVVGTGRAITFDAKVCDLANRFPCGNRDHVPAHQIEHLIRHGEAGAIAGLLIWATKRCRYFWMDWRFLSKSPSLEWSHVAMVELGDDARTVDFHRVPGVASRPADEVKGGAE